MKSLEGLRHHHAHVPANTSVAQAWSIDGSGVPTKTVETGWRIDRSHRLAISLPGSRNSYRNHGSTRADRARAVVAGSVRHLHRPDLIDAGEPSGTTLFDHRRTSGITHRRVRGRMVLRAGRDRGRSRGCVGGNVDAGTAGHAPACRHRCVPDYRVRAADGLDTESGVGRCRSARHICRHMGGMGTACPAPCLQSITGRDASARLAASSKPGSRGIRVQTSTVGCSSSRCFTTIRDESHMTESGRLPTTFTSPCQMSSTSSTMPLG